MPSTTRYKWGDVVLVAFPLSDMSGSLRRPGLVLFDSGDEDVMLARITTHFHAEYAESEASFTIDTLEVLEGELPRRPRAFVIEWASLHREELRANWELARQGLPLHTVEPLE
jgi:hypothetical protein